VWVLGLAGYNGEEREREGVRASERNSTRMSQRKRGKRDDDMTPPIVILFILCFLSSQKEPHLCKHRNNSFHPPPAFFPYLNNLKLTLIRK